MCGLVYSHNFKGKPVNNQVLDQFRKQRLRGTEGFGIFDGQEMNMVHEVTEKNITKWLRRYPSDLLMFHHRAPTSTLNFKRTAHPFSTKDYFGKTQYVLVHNGNVWNADELIIEHEELGIEYHTVMQDGSFNDSESLLWDFALYMEGKQPQMYAKGAIAFICMKIVDGKLTNLYFDRNYERPLKMHFTHKGLFLSSEGKGQMCETGTLYDYDYVTEGLSKTELKLETAPYEPVDNYHYTPPKNYPDEDNWMTLWEEEQYMNRKLDEPTPIRGGGWLSDELRKKFNVTPTVPVKQVPSFDAHQVTAYELGEGGVMHEVERTVYTQNPILTANTEVSAETLVMHYLIKEKGVYEKAYWAMERDYVKASGLPMKQENEEKAAMFERALDLITAEEEWKDEKSISSIWRALWQQQLLPKN